MRNRLRFSLRLAMTAVLLCAVAARLYVKCDSDSRYDIMNAGACARFHFKLNHWPEIVNTEFYFRGGDVFVIAQDEKHYKTLMRVNRFMGEVTVIYRVRMTE
jgi:hypothetical protein